MFSIWERTGFLAEPHLAVVGAGITGLFTALHYKRRFPAHRVLVFERGPHPSGASVKNAGFACFGSPSEILADIDLEGSAVATARVEERWRGLRALRAELGDDHIGFEPTGGHELFGESDPLYNRVAERFDELNNVLLPIFGQPVYEWRDHLKGDMGLQAGHIAFTGLEGPLDSGALMRTLLARVRASGVEVHFRVPVTAVEEDGAGALVMCGQDLGPVRCSQAVIATNGYATELLPGLDVRPARGQVLLTSPIPGLRLKGTFHAEEGYYYFRDYQGRVLLGGGRHLDKAGETTTKDAVTPTIQEALERMLWEVILPDRSFSIELRWSGVMGFRSQGKTPLVERITPRVVVAAGLSGMGVAIGIQVAQRAAELVRQ
ncbi:MAG: FAD-binding oxidoreductase [Flavobacteriales bacterium]|nr:FAD-binding oxidoreductase [Flavobacteriales bacterium]